MKKKFIFVIDTKQYSGNFEREMCAFVTGKTGQCEVGEEEAKLYRKTNLPDLDNLIRWVPDDKGCHRPTSIFLTPNWFLGGNKNAVRWTKKIAKQEAMKIAELGLIGSKQYYGPHLKEVNSRLRQKKFDGAWTEEYCLNEKNKTMKILAKAEVDATKLKIRAENSEYLGVAIYLNFKPKADIVALFKKRAKEFCKRKNIPLVGFRLLEEKIKAHRV